MFKRKFTKNVTVQDLLNELYELREILKEVNSNTEELQKEVTNMSLRIEKLKVDKLCIKNLELEGLEIKLTGGLQGGKESNE